MATNKKANNKGSRKGARDDRRALVEQMRKEQERKERRKSLGIVGVAVVIGALIIGFAVYQVVQADQSNSRDLEAIGVSASAAGCQDPTTEPAGEDAGNHLPEGQEIPYASPPAAGPHWARFLLPTEIRKFYEADDRPEVERLVHSLEHGHTILWYDETVADDDQQVEDLKAIASKFDGTGQEDKFIAAPWTADDGDPFPDGMHVALTHWSMGGTNGNPDEQVGVTQFCGEVSGPAVASFMEDYPADDSPEPNAA